MNKIAVHTALFSVSLFYAILFSWAGEIMPRYISPEGFVWLRIVTAAVLFNITALFFARERVDLKTDGLLLLVCAFFGTAGNMFMFFKGLSMTRPINGAVLMMVTPLFVSVFDHWKQRKNPALDTIFGLIIGTAGAAMLMAGKGAHFTSRTLQGDIWIAVNAAFYAVYLVLVKKLVHKYKPITVNRVTFTMGIFLIAPLGAAELAHTNFAAIPADIWWKMIYTLFFTSFLVYLLNSYGIKHGSSSLVGIYIYLQPILATIIAVMLGSDEMTWTKLILTLTVLFGVWLVLTSDKRTFSLKNIFGK